MHSYYKYKIKDGDQIGYRPSEDKFRKHVDGKALAEIQKAFSAKDSNGQFLIQEKGVRKVINEHISRWKHLKNKSAINFQENPHQTEERWKAIDKKLVDTYPDYDPVAAEALVNETLLKIQEMEAQKKAQEQLGKMSIDLKEPNAPTVPPVAPPEKSGPNPPEIAP